MQAGTSEKKGKTNWESWKMYSHWLPAKMFLIKSNAKIELIIAFIWYKLTDLRLLIIMQIH